MPRLEVAGCEERAPRHRRGRRFLRKREFHSTARGPNATMNPSRLDRHEPCARPPFLEIPSVDDLDQACFFISSFIVWTTGREVAPRTVGRKREDPMRADQQGGQKRPLALRQFAREFVQTEVAGSPALLSAAVVTLLWANSPWQGAHRNVPTRLPPRSERRRQVSGRSSARRAQ